MIGFENENPDDVGSDVVAFPLSVLEESVNDHIFIYMIQRDFHMDQYDGLGRLRRSWRTYYRRNNQPK